MYQASAEYITAIKSSVRKFSWSGEISTDTPIEFDGNDILSGSIIRKISENKLSIGTVYTSQILMELFLEGVSRYELYGKQIELSSSVVGASDEIPMGIFKIAEASQTANNVIIKGYDNMTKFGDIPFYPTQHTNIQSPFQWLSEMCTECGVELGMSSGQVLGLPNGGRKTGYADVVPDVKTWRDVLSYLATYLGGFAYIGRDNKLYIGLYRSTTADTIHSKFRYTSNLSDYRTTYNGIYGSYKEGGIQEYVANSNEDGIVLDIGVNPFLQFSDQSNRLSALGEIIDAWNGVYYVPFDSEMPLIPTYDTGDVLTFVDKQASQYDSGAITEITYDIVNAQMHAKCTGDNPKLASAQDRFSKSIAGLSADYNNGQQVGGKNFWLLHTENTSSITVDNTKTQVAEIEWNQIVDVQRMGFMFTCEINLSATAIVDVLITVDDSENYEFECTESKAMIGKRIISSTCGFRVTGKGTHTAKVYLKATDSPLIWNDLV